MTRQLTVLLVVLAAFVAPVAAHGVDLKPKLVPGLEVHYVLTASEESTRTVAGEADQPPHESKSTERRDVGMRLRCAKVEQDGSAVLEWTLLYLAITTEGDRPMGFDSRDPEQAESPEGMIFSQIINQPATVTVDAHGRLTDYQDPATIGGGPIRHYMRELLSDDAFAQLGFFVTRAAPADAITGTTWTETRPEELPYGLGTMLTASNYKLAAVEEAGKIAEIKVQGTLSMKAPEPAEDGSPAPPPGLLIDKGEFSGTSRWDYVAGQLASREVDMTMIGSASGPWGTIGLDQKSTVTITRATPEEFKRAMDKPPVKAKPEAKAAVDEKADADPTPAEKTEDAKE